MNDQYSLFVPRRRIRELILETITCGANCAICLWFLVLHQICSQVTWSGAPMNLSSGSHIHHSISQTFKFVHECKKRNLNENVNTRLEAYQKQFVDWTWPRGTFRQRVWSFLQTTGFSPTGEQGQWHVFWGLFPNSFECTITLGVCLLEYTRQYEIRGEYKASSRAQNSRTPLQSVRAPAHGAGHSANSVPTTNFKESLHLQHAC